jgi:Putative beta-barrel porin-2, OmpL-like. bbp2
MFYRIYGHVIVKLALYISKSANLTKTYTMPRFPILMTLLSSLFAPLLAPFALQASPALDTNIISGSADMYYRYDLARTDKNELTSFTRSDNQFSIGMAGIRIEHKSARIDMVADLGLGHREEEYAYNDKGTVQAIKQLYISYSPTSWLKFTGGTWETHLGYEVVDASGNRNYSMSYIFSSSPFSHTGVRADLGFGKNGFMIGIANPSDYRSIPPGGYDNKEIIAQYSYAANDNVKACLNYVGGRDVQNNKTHQIDITLTDKFSTLFSLGFNGSTSMSSMAAEKYASSRAWWGSALYLNLDPKKWLGFTLRTEYFDDPDGQRLPSPAAVFATTLSANIKVDGFTFIPEFRVDNASTPIFFDHDVSPVHTAANFLLAAIYSF